MPPRNATRQRRTGAVDGREPRHQGTPPGRCVCRRPATGYVRCHLLDDTVVILIGTCDNHGPADEEAALNLVRALLLGVSRAGSNIAVTTLRGRRNSHG